MAAPMAAPSSKATRGKGEGSVFKNEKTGLWTGTIELGRGPDGKRRRKYVRAKTKGETLRKMAKVRADIEAGNPVVDRTQTLSSYLKWWADNVLPGTVRDTTADGYRFTLRRYVEPHIGSKRLVDLGPEHVLAMLRALQKEGLSDNTCRQARSVLRRALGDAVRYEVLGRNVAASVKAPPKRTNKSKEVFTIDQVRSLLATVEGERIEVMIHIALTLGARRGEILGLKWDDIDLGQQTLEIRRTLKRRSHHGLVLAEPKTSAGKRKLPLTDELNESLRRHRSRQAADRLAAGEAWQDQDFVFTTTIGTPIEPRNFERHWKALCDEANVPGYNFHTTRHTAATTMLNAGVPLESITKILGHASVATTADLYAQPSADTIRDAVDRGAAAVR